jgi:hypothetical protein
MKSYSSVPDECTDRVAHLMQCFHRPLIEAGMKIDLISVATDGDEPALKLHGYPCAEVVRIVGLKDRSKGHGDAEIVIDEERYQAMSDPERDAVLDHELYHIELNIAEEAKTKGGVIIPKHVVLDAHGRPKLKLRKHDVQTGWFSEIAERHGAASQECKQAAQLVLVGRQTYFAFVGDSACLMQPSEPSEDLKSAARRLLQTVQLTGDACATMEIKTDDTEPAVE